MRTFIHVTVASFFMVMFLTMGSYADNDFSKADEETLACEKEIQKTFICKKNLFSPSQEFNLSVKFSIYTPKETGSLIDKLNLPNGRDDKISEGYCINGNPADEIPPWVFYSIEKTDDLEKTLVIDPQKPSASMVTRKRKFSTSEGYTWDEDKYYCKYE
jgi:hypothetical protein